MLKEKELAEKRINSRAHKSIKSLYSNILCSCSQCVKYIKSNPMVIEGIKEGWLEWLEKIKK